MHLNKVRSILKSEAVQKFPASVPLSEFTEAINTACNIIEDKIEMDRVMMPKEEIIKILKVAIAEVEWNYPLDYAIAFNNAIEIIQREDSDGCVGCKYSNKDLYEMPCLICTNNYTNMWKSVDEGGLE